MLNEIFPCPGKSIFQMELLNTQDQKIVKIVSNLLTRFVTNA